MTWLLTSDLHLTDRPRDAYRFGLFPWLARQQKKHNVTATFVLGDLTDQKDKHSSTLVNRLVEEFIGLRPPVFILKGNHDFIDPENPYFKFLSCIEGISFVTEPTWLEDHKVAMIPHQPDQASFDAACSIIQPSALGVMIHQTVDGALGEATGHRLTGLRASLISQMAPRARVLAGDIHRPQQAGPATYIGSPYHVRFGDDFQPRVLLIKNGKEQNLYFPAPHKWSLTVRDEDDLINNEDLRPGDQVKLTVELAREEAVEWAAHKALILEACKEMELAVYGVELKIKTTKPRERIKAVGVKGQAEIFNSFCAQEAVASNIKKVGLELLGVQN